MTNVGTLDRVGRLLIGGGLIAAAFVAPSLATGWSHWAAICAGAGLVATAIISVCPAYLPFGIRTCRPR